MSKLSKFTRNLIHFALALLAFGLIKEVWASPGNLDASGCHHPKGGAYHCHPAKKINRMSVIESPDARVSRLQRECAGKPKTGQCRNVRR